MKMGYTLTRRPYLMLGFFHMLFGLLLFATGTIWLLMTFFYWPNLTTEASYPDATVFYQNHTWNGLSDGYQAACWIVYTVQIWTGFLIMLSGCFAMCVRDYGCLERLFFTMNSFNLVILAPAAIVLSLEILFVVAGLDEFSFIYRFMEDSPIFFDKLLLNKDEYPWILAFPIAGVSLAFMEFVLSIVSCSICACCRPTKIYSY